MSTNAMIGSGASLGFSTTQATGYTYLGEVTEFSLSTSTDTADATNLGSGFVKAKIPAMSEPGSSSFTLHYYQANASIVFPALTNRTIYYWNFLLPDGGLWNVQGFGNKFDLKVSGADQIVMVDAGIEHTSLATFTA